MRTDDLDFQLPPELIAQEPAADRAASRLVHYRRNDRAIEHHRFSDVANILRKGDLLVFNDARVIPARFTLKKTTGGRVEGLFLSQRGPHRWEVLLKNLGGAVDLHFEDGVTARVAESFDEGRHIIEVSTDEPAIEFLRRVGRMPLPPYIKREKDHDARDDVDRERYQTVFARSEGSVAAPTAGLHFTQQLLSALDAAGIQRTSVTLDVGLGTFKPVTAERIEDHVMHVERYEIPSDTATALNAAKRDRRRIVAVGTTSARVLESQPDDRPFEATQSETAICIFPPYRWKHLDALVTNLHLPRSTLIALVAAFVGLEEQRELYRTAIEEHYRFFSYGDAMLLE